MRKCQTNFLNKIKRSYCKFDNNEDNLNLPFICALQNELKIKKEQFFFPGHSSGKYIPMSMSNLLNKTDCIFEYDLPELEGLDNIHSPQGPLKKSLENASKLFNSKKTWFSINGSTLGILVAILSVAQIHKKRMFSIYRKKVEKSIVLIGRDSHKSVYDGIKLSNCDAVLIPCLYSNDFGVYLSIIERHIEEAINIYDQKICGLVLTRPSYQGVIMNTTATKRIVDLCHSHNIPVIIDEAHGSHMKFMNNNDTLDGLSCSADIVIQSTHKTLQALSQCAMIHLNQNSFQYCEYDSNRSTDVIDIIQENFSALTTTSPNAILLASLESCVNHMSSELGINQLKTSILAALELKDNLRSYLKDSNIRLLDDSFDLTLNGLLLDPLRLSLRFEGLNAIEVDDRMCEDDNIYCELNLPNTLTYAIPIGSTTESLNNLKVSLLNHSRDYVDLIKSLPQMGSHSIADRISYLSLSESSYKEIVNVKLSHKNLNIICGQVVAETISVYPPGIPIVIKGEVLMNETVNNLLQLQYKILNQKLGSGCRITGCRDTTLQHIHIYKNDI